MPSYKLTYFDLRAAGELCRYVFVAAGREFEDDRVQMEDWPSIKPSAPFRQIPVLEVNGTKIAQSRAIARYLGREFGLDGKDSWEQLLVDQYICLAEDLYKHHVDIFHENDVARKAEMQKNLDDVLCPKFLRMFENELTKNGGKYFVGNKFTLADLAVLDCFDTPAQKDPNLMDEFPKLKAHRELIASNPNLAEYIKNRKCTSI